MTDMKETSKSIIPSLWSSDRDLSSTQGSQGKGRENAPVYQQDVTLGYTEGTEGNERREMQRKRMDL
ncbi:hypothetical protein JOQ06_030429 [Pogonophryne albipinna]|uniref:Uncharacterized protein n=1 Tax=Pogonophryne albipinna TaxID=1090488 RepID=A0AAD6AY35_9TELE|nr:hypothetical protein JOQ06_030429 [Pogonophryne albipinna]